MTDKKRTTVTTIETHEVWIIRRAAPELADVEATEAITVTTPVPPWVDGDSSEDSNQLKKERYKHRR